MILSENDKYEIVSLAIASKILDEFWIYYDFIDSMEFSIKIYKENKEFEIIDVPNFSKMIENDDFFEFTESYKEFLTEAYKIKYNKELVIYGESDYDRVEDVNNVTDVLGDNEKRLVPFEYESIDTRCYLSESVSNQFWCNGGIDELETQLEEECPNVVVAHYKGKYFYVYERMDNTDSSFVYMYVEDFESYLDDIDLSEFDGKYDLAKDYCRFADEYYYDNFIYSVKVHDISEQLQRAKKIIEVTKEGLEYESAVDYVMWGEDYESRVEYVIGGHNYGSSSSIYRLIEESDIVDNSLLETILEDFKDCLYSIHEQDIAEFVKNPIDYSYNLFHDKYIKENKFKFDVYTFNREKYEREFHYTFEYDFIKVFREYVEKHYLENYELVFDESYNGYKVVNLDIDDSYGYHVNTIELVFRTEETIVKAIDNLNRRRIWIEEQVKNKKLKEEAVKNVDFYSIMVKDSYDSGNCVSGTKKFCDLFSLPTDNKSELPAKDFLKYIDKSPSEFKSFAERTLVTAYKRYLEENSI